MLFDKFINSVAMAKTTFFSKTLRTQARFSPRRDVFVATFLLGHVAWNLSEMLVEKPVLIFDVFCHDVNW